MLFMVMRLKESSEVFLVLWKTPMMDLFQKQEKLKYDGLAFLKELTCFKIHRLKMLEFYNKMREGSTMEWSFVFKINKEMCVVTPNL